MEENINNNMPDDMQTQSEDSTTQTQEPTQTQSQDNGFRNIFGDYADNPSLQKFKTPADVAKSYIELEKLVGRKRVPIPDPDNEEELFGSLKEMGLPEDPGKYQIQNEDELKDVFGEDVLNQFKQLAHESGMLPQQFNKFMSKYTETLSDAISMEQENMKQQLQNSVSELQKEWGDSFDTNIAIAQRAFQSLPDNTRALIEQSGLGNDPAFVKFMHSVGKHIVEGNSKSFANMNVTDPQSEINKILANKSGPYYDRSHPEHKATVERVNELYSMMYNNT